MLSIKTVALLTLLLGQRVSTVQKFKIFELQKTPEMVIFTITDLLKHSRPNYRSPPIVFHAYLHDCNVCPVAVIGSYLSARALLKTHNKSDQFILCYRNLHGPATTNTITRWVKTALENSGIDQTFSAHSCRAASTSKAMSAGVSLENILNAAQWSKESAFYNFYKKDIVTIRDQCK